MMYIIEIQDIQSEKSLLIYKNNRYYNKKDREKSW